MAQHWKANFTLSSITGLVRTIVGSSEPGYLLANGGGTNAVLASSAPGGFYSSFPGTKVWDKHYLRGMGRSIHLDVFWRACLDVGLEFSPLLGVAGYDEDHDRPLSTNQAFDELARRIHFHWFYSNSSGYDVARPAGEWTVQLSASAGLANSSIPISPLAQLAKQQPSRSFKPWP